MKIIQVLPCLNKGDAVGNDCRAIHKLLQDKGYTSVIYSDIIQDKNEGIAIHIDDWVEPEKDDVIIYHLSVGWRHIDLIEKAKCKKMFIYHNVTPPMFYEEYDRISYLACIEGLDDVILLRNSFDYGICDSDFNRSDLIKYGYKCPMDVVPILIPFEDYKRKADEGIINKYKNSEGTKILFTGRVVPNKKQEDVIRIFYLYKKYFDEKAKLFIVGSFNENSEYCKRLANYKNALELEDVIFTKHISFEEILGYYEVSDLFLCMSEHEGFCVPLVESMLFDLPVLAYDAGAIKETLGNSGIVFSDKNYLEIAAFIDYLMKDENLKKSILEEQRKRLKDFDTNIVSDMFIEKLEKFISEVKK